MTDIVFVDTQYPNQFDLATWRGTDGLSYSQSQDFAWYQLMLAVEVEGGQVPQGDCGKSEFGHQFFGHYARGDPLIETDYIEHGPQPPDHPGEPQGWVCC